MSDVIVEVKNLYKRFPVGKGGVLPFLGTKKVVHAVEDVDLKLYEGDFLGLIGESGSGKTTLANCIVGLLEPTNGSILLEGNEVVRSVMQDSYKSQVSRFIDQRVVARRVQMVFQDPTSALNPRIQVGKALREALKVHEWGISEEIDERVQELFELVGIPINYAHRYPHELNAAQRQRVVIARALALEPDVLLADEPISHLDVSGQAQIMNLLLELQDQLKLSTVFIAHDMSAVRQVASRVAVMYLGQLMEVTDAQTFFTNPSHPYSHALVASVPRFKTKESDEISIIEGEIPSPIDFPKGCPFLSRCPEGEPEICGKEQPPLLPLDEEEEHLVACYMRYELGKRDVTDV